MFFCEANKPDRTTIKYNSKIVFGAYTYNKPNLVLEYDDNCFPESENSTLLFDTCSLTGNVRGNSIIVINDVKEFKFIRVEN